MIKKPNPLVFLDVSIDGDPGEIMVFELFSDAAPKTAENFRALCTGEKGNSRNTGRPLHYKGSIFHHIAKGFIAQGGYFLQCGGTVAESSYGEKFPDKPISKLKHDEHGLLTMAVPDRDVRGSMFSITFKPHPELDREHLVFGKLVQGYEVLEKIEKAGEEDGIPSVAVEIVNCGEFVDVKKHKGKHKKSSRQERKRRRKYYNSDLETSLDSKMDSSDSDFNSDSASSSLSSSSDDKRKKRKRSSKQDRYKRGKKKSKRHVKKHRKRGRKSNRYSKRASDSIPDTDSQSERSDDDADVNGNNKNHKPQAEVIARNQPPLADEAASVEPEEGTKSNTFEKEAYPKENGARQSLEINLEVKAGTAADRPDIVNGHPGQSRSRSLGPKRSLRKSMSITSETSWSSGQNATFPSFSESPEISSRSRSPSESSRVSLSSSSGRGPSRRSISKSPVRVRTRCSYSRGRSPVSNRGRSLSKRTQDGSPKRIRRGTGFSQQRFSYTRRYRTPSPDHSPVRSYRYGRNDHERYRSRKSRIRSPNP